MIYCLNKNIEIRNDNFTPATTYSIQSSQESLKLLAWIVKSSRGTRIYLPLCNYIVPLLRFFISLNGLYFVFLTTIGWYVCPQYI